MPVESLRTPQANLICRKVRDGHHSPSLTTQFSGRRQVMNKVASRDIVGNAAYEKMREKSRQRIIELKRHRRVSVGDKVTLVFENRDTVIFQIQEMMRAEKISDLDKIREEIEVYNELIPAPGELSATLFLEIEDQTHLREDLLKFLGIDESVYLKVGNHSIHARFEEGHSKEDKISAVQYVKFPFSEAIAPGICQRREGGACH